MVVYFLVVLAFLCGTLVALRLRRDQISVIFILIVTVYLLLGPFLNSFNMTGNKLTTYYIYHPLIIILFYMPFLGFMAVRGNIGGNFSAPKRIVRDRFVLPIIFPIFLLLLLVVFWNTVLEGGLLFRRIGHEALFQTTTNIPKLWLYLYRLTVESSFFIVMILSSVTKVFCGTTKNYGLYRFTLVCFVLSFSFYFAINSRMQFLILILVLMLNVTGLASNGGFRKIVVLFVSMVSIIISLTLFRELFLEGNDRLNDGSFMALLSSTVLLVAARSDILEIFYYLDSVGYDPLSINLIGIKQSIYFPISFLIDREYYDYTKATLQTSSSVAAVNEIAGSDFVDFPKTYVVDALLAFGALILPLVAVIYAGIISMITKTLRRSKIFGARWLLLVFMIPILLQFEKELMTPIIAFLKWSPILVISIVLCRKIKAVTRIAVNQSSNGSRLQVSPANFRLNK